MINKQAFIKARRTTVKAISIVGRRLRSVVICTVFGSVLGCMASPPVETVSPVLSEPDVVETPTSVIHIEGERPGFVITENAELSGEWLDNFDQAVQFMQDDQNEQAILILESLVQQEPQVSAPYINLAMAYRKTGQLELAEQQVKKALLFIRNHPVAQNEHGLLLRQTGRFEEARDVYEETLQYFPEYLPVRLNLGILCEIYLQDEACALEQYTYYSKYEPEDERVQLWIAGLKLRSGHN